MMMVNIWILKAVTQKVISLLPASHKINYFFQKNITRGLHLTDPLFNDKLSHCREHFHYYQKFSDHKDRLKVLELGTGWFPVVPIGMFLCGVDEIITIDIQPLIRKKNVIRTINKMMNYHLQGKLKTHLPDMIDDRWEQLAALMPKMSDMSLAEIFQTLKIHTLVKDARHLPLPDHSVDLITSNNTFEHIYPKILSQILVEFRRVLKPGGVMSHAIDMSDHFAHLDQSISIYNFLRFSDNVWNWIDNTIQPQNRLRVTDFRALYKQLGIDIVKEELRPGDQQLLQTVPVHKKFRHIPLEDLAISHCTLISKS